MPVVHGDKIGESKRLNRCSVEASDFYGSMLNHEVPDDFGRFRDVPHLVHTKMYPRREPTPTSLRRVARLMAELRAAGLWRTWTHDDVTFAEMYNWTPRGNLYHRTPEPPRAPSWPVHEHTRRCATTALARANDWGDRAGAEFCLSLLNKVGGTEPGQAPGRGRAGFERGVAKGVERDPAKGVEHPSVPSVPSVPTDTDPPQPPADAGGDLEYEVDLDLAETHADNNNGDDPHGLAAQKQIVDEGRRYAIQAGQLVRREDLRELRTMVRGGATLEHVKAFIDHARAQRWPGLVPPPL